MRGSLSCPTATSIATTAKGNFAISLRGIDVSPLEYVPASRSPVRSRERSERVGAGVWLSLGLPAPEKSPFGVALIEGGTKSAAVRSAFGAGADVGPRDDPPRPVRLLDLLHRAPAENLLGATENLASLGVAKLAPLAVGGQLPASDEPVALPERQRDRRALDLEHLAVHLREERQDLVHEDPECGWRSLGRRAGGSGEDERDEDGSVCQLATLHHNRCQLLTPRHESETGHGRYRPMPRSAARSERRLEGEPDARGHRVGVFRIACRLDAVENLGCVQRLTRCEVSADDIERHVRGELPPEPDIRLSTDVAGVALREGLATWQHGPATGRVDTRVGVDLLRRPRRVDGQKRAERWGDGVGPSEAKLGAAVTVVADEAARLGHDCAAGTVVLVTQAYDRAPRGVVARVGVERLVVTDPLAQVVPGLVARAVDTANFEEQRAVLEAADGVEVEGALLCFSLDERAAVGAGDRQLVTSPPLIEQRGIEAPGAEPPARVKADRVTRFVKRRVAARIRCIAHRWTTECRYRVGGPTREMRV